MESDRLEPDDETEGQGWRSDPLRRIVETLALLGTLYGMFRVNYLLAGVSVALLLAVVVMWRSE